MTFNALNHEFTENGSFTFTATDEAGNKDSVTVTIDNIDKVDPDMAVAPYETGWTSESITVTVSDAAVDGLSAVTFNATSHEFTENGSFTFTATDEAGNMDSVTVTIDNIDKVDPDIAVAPYETDWTSESITVTVSDAAADGFSNIVFNATSHEFTENGSFTFTATDEAGNIDSMTVTIDNIDKVDPDIAVGTYETDWTSESITVTVSDAAVDGLSNVTFNATSHEFTENGSFTFTATDEAGNTDSVTVIIDNIDKVDPDIAVAPYETGWTSESITVTVSDAAVDGLSDVTFNATSHEFTENGSFTFTATDEAGNTDSVTVTIDNIDKVDPVLNISGDNPYIIDLNEKYEDPGATAGDDSSGIAEAVSSSSTVDTSRLGTYKVTYRVSDNAGNEVEAIRIVEVVDQLKPTCSKKLSTGSETVIIMGSIDNLGASNDLIRYGFVWSTETLSPTMEDSYCELTDLTGPGEFKSMIRNLSSNTQYHIRAFAEDSTAVRYSDIVSFKTDKEPIESVTVIIDSETTEPEGDEKNQEAYDFREDTTIPEVISIIDSNWIADHATEEGQSEEGADSSQDIMVNFGTDAHSIILPVSDLLYGDIVKAEGYDNEPEGMEKLEITVREERPVIQNYMLADVSEDQKEDRAIVSPVVTYEAAAVNSDGSKTCIDSFDSYVERQITVESYGDVDPSNLVAVRFDEETGELVPVPASFEQKEDGTLVATVSDNRTGSYTIIENNRDYQSELPEDHWATEVAVSMSTKLMLEEVFSEGMDLETGITRAEMAGVLLKTLGINKNDANSESAYEDLPSGSRWYETVLAATEAGILKGYGDGSVKPEKVISREEMAAVIYRTMDKMIEMAEVRDRVIYNDHEAIKAWALGQVNALTEIEVFEGYETGEFVPGSDIKVGEALTALYRMSRYLRFID